MKAREMRRSGMSIRDIAGRVAVSKSTVSKWCLDITLTPVQVSKLEEGKAAGFMRRRLLASSKNRERKLEILKQDDVWAKELIRRVSNREILFVVIALYWAEGSKSESTSGFLFVNSDPEMILMMKRFLVSSMGISLMDIRCRIQINEIHKPRIDIVLNFWKNLLELDYGQIKQPYFIKARPHKVYENYDSYFGVCRLFLRNGGSMKYKMLALIKAIKAGLLPA